MKKVIIVGAVAGLLLTTVVPRVFATSLNQQMSDVQKKQENVNKEKDTLQSQLKDTQATREEAEKELKRLTLALSETNAEISAMQAEIDDVQGEIKKSEEEIKEIEARMDRRYEILKRRLVSIQRSGGAVTYLEVLLGSQSFADFVDRMNAVSIIMKSDKEILEDQERDQQALIAKKQEQKNQLAQLEGKRKEMDALFQKLQQQSEKQKALKAQLQQKEEQIEEELLSAEEEQRILKQQQATIQRAIEEEKKKQEATQNNNKPNTGGSEGPRPSVSEGTFIRPAVGPVTSEFGPRWGKFHYGIDLGKRSDNVPIVAVADGIVSSSYYSSSYGNVVIINHSVNGKVYTTVSAHLENRAVTEGQRVSKGDFLGYMGNTGRSTGPHLHFEFHEGQWTVGKENAVNPRKYIKF